MMIFCSREEGIRDKIITRTLISRIDQRSNIFLWTLTLEILAHPFPIGGYKKVTCENWRKSLNYRRRKKDSQGLCFVGKIDFKDFLKNLLLKNPAMF